MTTSPIPAWVRCGKKEQGSTSVFPRRRAQVLAAREQTSIELVIPNAQVVQSATMQEMMDCAGGRPLSITARAYEPDIIGLDRHRVLLNEIFKARGPQEFGPLRPLFHFEYAGRFLESTGKGAPLSFRITQSGDAHIQVSISRSMQLLSGSEHRIALFHLLQDSIEELIKRAERKKLPFDKKRYREFMNGVLSEYLSTPLPLPATSAELDYAHNWLGIPVDAGDRLWE